MWLLIFKFLKRKKISSSTLLSSLDCLIIKLTEDRLVGNKTKFNLLCMEAPLEYEGPQVVRQLKLICHSALKRGNKRPALHSGRRQFTWRWKKTMSVIPCRGNGTRRGLWFPSPAQFLLPYLAHILCSFL